MPLHAYTRVRPLSDGARVALVAPAGPLRGPEELKRAIENVQTFGWEPVVGVHALASDGYLAGSDAERLDDLNRALCDDTVDAVWCLRGGYGVTRILDGVAYAAVRRRPKAVIGYSDITALHAAIGRECEVLSYHGPTARGDMTPFSRDSFERALVYAEDPCGAAPRARTIRPGKARGRLMGGNLALVTALVGTRYAPDLADAILVLEDVNEPVYRVDRMLRQLLMAGALERVAAVAFGQCTEGAEEEARQGGAGENDGIRGDARTEHHDGLDTVLREIARRLDVPCVAGLPVGHVDDQWTLPLGAVATLDAEALTLTVDPT